jgi:TPR repeat protein
VAEVRGPTTASARPGQHFFWAAAVATNQAEVDKNYKEAGVWLNQAAELGYPDAQNNLGYLYSQGYGVPHSVDLAIKNYRAAALKGFAKAQGNLGLLYQDGTGVPKDLVEAYKWFKLAANQGEAIGRRQVEEFRDKHLLTSEQFEEAERAARSFRPEPAERTTRVEK